MSHTPTLNVAASGFFELLNQRFAFIPIVVPNPMGRSAESLVRGQPIGASWGAPLQTLAGRGVTSVPPADTPSEFWGRLKEFGEYEVGETNTLYFVPR